MHSNSKLLEFLRARLDEDEAAARAATAGPWEWELPEQVEWSDHGPHLMSKTATWTTPEGRGPYPVMVVGSWGHDAWGIDVEDADAAHIARHDPARVLREVEAKRAILSAYTNAFGQILDNTSIYLGGGYTMRGDWVVRRLASVYSDHPDYRPEWAG